MSRESHPSGFLSDDACVAEFERALAEVRGRGETPARLQVGYRLWEALASRKITVLDKWDSVRGRTKCGDFDVVVREDFDGSRIRITTLEEEQIFRLLEDMHTRAMRDTGLAPLLFELGSKKAGILERAAGSNGASHYKGVPVVVNLESPDLVSVRLNAEAPTWVRVGAFIAKKEDDEAWGKIVKILPTSVELDPNLEPPQATVTFGDLRSSWQAIAPRSKQIDRFLRVLRDDPVLD